MPGKLTKNELAKEIARVCGSSLKKSRQMLDLILDAMVRTLSRGERVEVRNFGSFATRVRKARVGRNPVTGVDVQVRAKRVTYFRASKQMRELLAAQSRDEAHLADGRG